MEKYVTVAELCDELALTVITDGGGLERRVGTMEINRPGLALTGFLKYFPSERVQVIGQSEMAYLASLSDEEAHDRLLRVFSYENLPCVVVTRDLPVTQNLMAVAAKANVPLLHTVLSTPRFIAQLTTFLDLRLAPETLVHGVLVDVYGIGILMVGASGIGKSETALELLKRGHRMVADDAVEIRKISEDTLVGTAPPLLQHLLEIRGLGVLNAMTLFGAGAIRTHKRIEMMIELEAWQDDRSYDRLGLDEEKRKILDFELTCLTVPVRPGRNLAIIIEVAAMNQRLKRMGYHAARELSEKLMSSMVEHDD
ncbi:MAG: HPr(Ser) kinase/phosphatase [Acidibacillus sp.]|uniref:HPr kinase/phosphorylase n=1 Tax=Sulfoacidibacillus ferrooxidans TaxID=2005001 RepID=A0A9X1V7K6_9BACL|nr:HPr(Ser) kinase/phosphatase [Sulfoacidibacillus ferrooxidans]MCI0182733.1 HPr kinase/phosphorylase [Sulfoacidibacillus ferrooxidans]MCY0892522.1 HPr(Ser) kinase/phosphatase [Acidibacillus sp.]